MTRWHLLLTLALVFAIALVFGPAPVHAEQYGASDGEGESVETEYEPDGFGWTIDDGGDGNQDVYYDPDKGPWYKTLTFSGTAVAGQIYTLTEKLHVDGGPFGTAPAWTDYHEIIETPGWTWSPIGPNDENTWGFTASDWDYSWVYRVSADNEEVDWTFTPPLDVCNNITITKYLVYDGSGDPTAPLIIAEYPTVPEPGTLALLAAAGLCALVWGRRKRRT